LAEKKAVNAWRDPEKGRKTVKKGRGDGKKVELPVRNGRENREENGHIKKDVGTVTRATGIGQRGVKGGGT